MAKKERYFPHIYRFFSARVVRSLTKVLLLITMTVILLLNLWSILFPKDSNFNKAKWQVLTEPNSPQAHLNLAEVYYKEGASRLAKDEFLLAIKLANQQNSGHEIAQTALKKLEESENEVEELKKGLEFWQKVAQEKTDYRDAYIQTAAYAYRLKRYNMAKEALEKALELDPNNETALKLMTLLPKIGNN